MDNCNILDATLCESGLSYTLFCFLIKKNIAKPIITTPATMPVRTCQLIAWLGVGAGPSAGVGVGVGTGAGVGSWVALVKVTPY